MDGKFEVPLTAHRELKTHHRNIAEIATNKLNNFLGIKMETPKVEIKYNEGDEICIERRDGKQIPVLRPFKRIERKGTYQFPDHATIHEVAHAAEDIFLDLPYDRGKDTAVFLSEGFAEYLSVDDPTEITISNGQENAYIRAGKSIKIGGPWGKTLASYLSLDNLFSTYQFDLKKEPLSEDKEAKSMAPYIIGSSLVRFIVEKGGLDSLKYVMQQVQVDKNYAFGWSRAASADFVGLIMEEMRVNNLYKKAIADRLGDVKAFEREWREKVIKET